jgi:hypothetical protein
MVGHTTCALSINYINHVTGPSISEKSTVYPQYYKQYNAPR